MKNKWISILLVAALLLCACSSNENSLLNPNSNPKLSSTAASDAAESTTTPMSLPSGEEAASFPVSYELPYYDEFDDGTLYYTITGAQLITGEKSLNPEYVVDNGEKPGVIIYHPEYREQYEKDRIAYTDKYIEDLEISDLLDKNGKLHEGLSAILLDVTVENRNETTCWTIDENGEPEYDWEDPYAFDIAAIGKVTDYARPAENSEKFDCYDFNYFSLTGSCADAPYCYHLEPGESVSFQVGCIVGTDKEGNEKDLSQCALTLYATADSLLAELHLWENE